MQHGEREPDRIRLTGISATGYHGVFEHERREGQTFTADVVLHVDTRPAAASDDLTRTVDYGVLAEQVTAVLVGEPADLIETVAERIAAVALAHQGVSAVEVVLHKPQAPITVPFTDVTVEIRRDRSHLPAVVGPPFVVDPEPAPQPVPVPAGPASTSLATPADDVAPSPADVVPDPLDRVPEAPVDVVLALGSNLGASHDTLRTAIAQLDAVPGLELTGISPLARTSAVGGPEQPDYLNAVVVGRTTLSPRAVLHACQEVEALHGRERIEHWGPRTLDVDVVVHGTTVASSPDLEVPHPRAHERAFVLEPWAQLDPTAVLPGLGGGPVADLARTAPDRDGIRWMALDWWQGREEPR